MWGGKSKYLIGTVHRLRILIHLDRELAIKFDGESKKKSYGSMTNITLGGGGFQHGSFA